MLLLPQVPPTAATTTAATTTTTTTTTTTATASNATTIRLFVLLVDLLQQAVPLRKVQLQQQHKEL